MPRSQNRTPALGGPGSFTRRGEGSWGAGCTRPALVLMWLLAYGVQALRVAGSAPPQYVASLQRPVTFARVGDGSRGEGAERTLCLRPLLVANWSVPSMG
jgi:hypothetical protein